MKNFHFFTALVVGALSVTACGNNTGSNAGSPDSSANLMPVPGNSSATNPSLADTAYSKGDSTKMKADSSAMKQ